MRILEDTSQFSWPAGLFIETGPYVYELKAVAHCNPPPMWLGLYADITPAAISPYDVAPTGGQNFYRVLAIIVRHIKDRETPES